MSNSLVKNDQKKESISSFLCKPAIKGRIMEMMSGKDGEQFITSIVAAVNSTPALQDCDMMSVFGAAMQIQALKLSPSPVLGQAFMIPFKNNKKGITEAKFTIGYKGLIQLAIRSGYYKRLNVLALKKGELIKFNEMTEEIKVKLIEDDEIREEAETTHYYASFEYLNGFQKTLCWSKKKMIAHADKYVSSFSKANYIKLINGEIKKEEAWKYSGFWYSDFDTQGCKTMIRKLISGFGIMSIDLQQAVETDIEQDIKESKSEDDFIFAEKSNPDPVYQENTYQETAQSSPQSDLNNENPFV